MWLLSEEKEVQSLRMKNEDEKSVRTFDIDIAYRGDGALAADLGSIIEQARRTVYRAVDVMLVYRN